MGLHGDSDDYGLPKVDIVVPDDARDLDRDVLAYRRELRQQRRRTRWRRLLRPFTRYGIAAPFIASAVLIALISGVLMTVVSPRQSARTIPIPPTGIPAREPGSMGGPLPTGNVIVAGRAIPVRDLVDVAGVIVIVPRGCGCDAAVTDLARQATSQRFQLQVWLVADGPAPTGATAGAFPSGSRSVSPSASPSGGAPPPGPAGAQDDVRRLAAGVPRGGAIAVEDPGRVLSSTYRAKGLTAVLVRPDRVVRDVLRDITGIRDFSADLQALQTPS